MLALSTSAYLEPDGESGGVRLIGCECADCGQRVFPPVGVCPSCMSEAMKALPLSREGKLYSYSVMRGDTPGYGAPYIIIFADMPEGVRVFSHLVGINPEDVVCDMAVRVVPAEPVMDKLGREVRLFQFAPAAAGVQSAGAVQ